MVDKPQITGECAECGLSLPPTVTGPCPSCGGVERKINVIAQDTINVVVNERVSWTKTREYFENHRPALAAVILVTAGTPVIGVFVAGFIGAVIGLALGIVGLFVGFYARTKVREIARGGDCQ